MSSRPHQTLGQSPGQSLGILSLRTGPLVVVLLGLSGLAGHSDAAHSLAAAPPVGGAKEGDDLGAGLLYSTQLGGQKSDQATSMAMDVEGCLYVTGWTRSGNFPTTQEAYDRSVDQRDAFVSKFSPDGQDLIWSTVLGGSRDEEAQSLVLEDSGVVLVGGWTASDDFPTSALAYRGQRSGHKDGFLTAIDASGGEILFSTFVGGSRDDAVTAISRAPDGGIALAGWTESSDLPTLEYALQSDIAGKTDAFVIQLDPVASHLRYATYLGGRGEDTAVGLAFDGEGYLTIAGTTGSSDFPVTSAAFDGTRSGSDVFVARLTPDGENLAYSTFYGGNRDEIAQGFALGEDGSAVVVGRTRSNDLAVAGLGGGTRFGRTDGFVMHLAASGGALIFARYVGGSGDDSLSGVTFDELGRLWVGGRTESDDLEVSSNASQRELAGMGDGFLALLDPSNGSITHATYLGGTGDEALIALTGDLTQAGVGFVGQAVRTDRRTRGAYGGTGGASDALVGRYAPGDICATALVATLGNSNAPILSATTPRLGGGLLLTLDDADPLGRGLYFLGTPAKFPLVIEGMGTLFLDPQMAVPVAAFTTDRMGQSSLSLTIPDSPELCGLEVVLQALLNGKTTGAVSLTLGN